MNEDQAWTYTIDDEGLVRAVGEFGRLRFDCYEYEHNPDGDLVYSVSFTEDMFERFVAKYLADQGGAA